MTKLDWKKEAINDLNNYPKRKNSVLTMSEKIATLEAKAERLGAASNSTPVQGGANKTEDMLINYIAEKQKLEFNIAIAKKHIAAVERGLSYLSNDEKKVLTFFYIDRPTNHIDRLCDELHFEKSRIYQIKDSALYRFTVAMYAIIDL